MLLVLALAGAQQRPQAPFERAYSAFSKDKTRRFDFWVGSWDVNLRMLEDDGAFHDAVSARANIYSILDGKAVLELWDSAPIVGYSLRYYDPASDQWQLFLDWPQDNQSRISRLSGSFRHGRAEFQAERERDDGTSLLMRYSFDDITPFSLRWDDLFSTDGGKTWRPNWIMEFSRTALEPVWPIPRPATPTFHDGTRCSLASFRPYEALAGEWTGTLTSGATEEAASLAAYRVLDGCAVVVFLAAPSRSSFAFSTFDTSREAWVVDWLTSAPGEPLERFLGQEGWGELATEDGASELRFRIEGDRLQLELSRNGSRLLGSFEKRQS